MVRMRSVRSIRSSEMALRNTKRPVDFQKFRLRRLKSPSSDSKLFKKAIFSRHVVKSATYIQITTTDHAGELSDNANFQSDFGELSDRRVK